MFSHVTLGTNDLDRSESFYTPALAALNLVMTERPSEHPYILYAPKDGRHPHLFICLPFDGLPATWSNGFHIALVAASQDAVNEFYEAGMSHGAIDDGPPGLRAHYNDDYYAAYLRDPDGNKLQAVCYLNGRKVGDTGDVVSHITLGVDDFVRERAFYRAVLTTLGYQELVKEAGSGDAAFGIEGCELPLLYVQQPFDGRPATWGNGTHTAFLAPSRNAVDQFHVAALECGASDEGPPGVRPDYSQTYYAAYVRDLVGNKLQAVYRGPA